MTPSRIGCPLPFPAFNPLRRTNLAQSMELINQAQQQITSGWGDYYDGVALLEQQRESGRQQLDDAQAQLDQGQTEYDQGLAQYNESVAQVQAQLEEGQQQLERCFGPDQ